METLNNRRIVKNTAVLYFRMFFITIVTLYTSRVILNILGVNDFGIYNVVGGLVTMFTFINSAMSAATSRYLILELGKKDYLQLKKIFNVSLILHIGIAILVLILSETIGLWFLTHKLVIPPERMNAAHLVLQLSILSTVVMTMQVPYLSVIIAREKMDVFAYISIVQVTLQLVIVYLLRFGDYDRLKLFAALSCFVIVLVFFIYYIYCKINFRECSFFYQSDKKLYTKLLSFSVWQLYGALGVMGMGQGVNLLLNIYFGPVVNAARGLAFQVQGAIGNFGDNILLAVKPQIIKLYAENDLRSMMSLTFLSTKYSYLLTFLFTLPLFLETQYILELWLKLVPAYTVSFCRLVLLTNLINSMRGPIITCLQATGNIKLSNTICGSLYYLIIILSYTCLKIGFIPESVFIVTIFISFIIQLAELVLLKRYIKYSLKDYAGHVIFQCFIVTLVAAIIPSISRFALEPGFYRFFIVGITSVLFVSLTVLFIGFDKITRIKFLTIISNRIKRNG